MLSIIDIYDQNALRLLCMHMNTTGKYLWTYLCVTYAVNERNTTGPEWSGYFCLEIIRQNSSTCLLLSMQLLIFCYSDVLQSRAKLIEETDSMRRQNAELRILLHQYVNSQASYTLSRRLTINTFLLFCFL